MAKLRSGIRAACPKGHTDELRLRFVADAPLRLVDLGRLRYLEPILTPAKHVEVQAVDSQPGIDGGVWCPTCEEWYEEGECFSPLDDADSPRTVGPRAGRR